MKPTDLVHHARDVCRSHAMRSIHQLLSLRLPRSLLRTYDGLVVVVGEMSLVDKPPVRPPRRATVDERRRSG